ncbi:MAG TPA: sigma-70 family RNA polymerase sigma factor [Gemmataceae bacterium]|nr:sigma-70 family RNA polymerase sigma factor [Gemmataceae bacterium]
MQNGQMTPVLRFLRRLGGADAVDDLADAHLVDRFVARRDDEAFAILVRRHGPMVLSVCRRVLHDLHDAEDAFQATFLVLARKAGSIGRRERLGNWLHGVAYRTALKARANAARWQEIEEPPIDSSIDEPLSDLARRELRLVLDEEVGRLPGRYRAPVVLCYLEGHSYAEAARQLGCPPGTVSGRLARARELLRGRLARRGFALSAALIGTLLPASAPAAVSVSLVESTVKAAAATAAGRVAVTGAVAAPVVALAEGVIKAMLWAKIKITVAVVLIGGLVGASGSVYRSQAADAPKENQATAPAEKEKEGAAPAQKTPATKPSDKSDLINETELLLLRLRLEELKRAQQQLAAQRELIEAQRRLAEALDMQRRQEAKQRQVALDQIERALDQLRKTSGDKAKAIEDFDKAFKQLKDRLAKPEPKPAAKPEPPPEGVVSDVAKDGLARITFQSDAGVKRGQVLHVYRLEPEPLYLGTLTLVTVKGKEAVGKVDNPDPKRMIKPKDRVTVISPD